MGAALSALGDVGGEGATVGAFLMVMITFLFVDIFDTAGTLYSVGRQAGYVDENDELHKSDEAFMSDAAVTIIGAALGTSTTTYIESVAGVEDGGKDRPYSSNSRCSNVDRPILRGSIPVNPNICCCNGISCYWGNDDAPSSRHQLGRF